MVQSAEEFADSPFTVSVVLSLFKCTVNPSQSFVESLHASIVHSEVHSLVNTRILPSLAAGDLVVP